MTWRTHPHPVLHSPSDEGGGNPTPAEETLVSEGQPPEGETQPTEIKVDPPLVILPPDPTEGEANPEGPALSPAECETKPETIETSGAMVEVPADGEAPITTTDGTASEPHSDDKPEAPEDPFHDGDVEPQNEAKTDGDLADMKSELNEIIEAIDAATTTEEVTAIVEGIGVCVWTIEGSFLDQMITALDNAETRIGDSVAETVARGKQLLTKTSPNANAGEAVEVNDEGDAEGNDSPDAEGSDSPEAEAKSDVSGEEDEEADDEEGVVDMATLIAKIVTALQQADTPEKFLAVVALILDGGDPIPGDQQEDIRRELGAAKTRLGDTALQGYDEAIGQLDSDAEDTKSDEEDSEEKDDEGSDDAAEDEQ